MKFTPLQGLTYPAVRHDPDEVLGRERLKHRHKELHNMFILGKFAEMKIWHKFLKAYMSNIPNIYDILTYNVFVLINHYTCTCIPKLVQKEENKE